MKQTIALAFIVTAIPTHACMGGAEKVFPILALVLLGAVSLYFASANFLLHNAEEPAISEGIDSVIIALNFPLALYVSAKAMKASGSTYGAWRCTYSDSLTGQIIFHIILPLAFAVLAVLISARLRKDRPNLRVMFLWVVFGLWGTAIATIVAASQHATSGSTSFWRALHYGNIAMLILSALVMPVIGRRIKSEAKFMTVFVFFIFTGLLFAKIWTS